jgi:regulator of replication initiation timing
MSHDFIQNAVNALYQSNELMALKGELANLKAKADQSEAENARLKAEVERLTYVDDFIVITKPSIKQLIEQGAQNTPGRYDEQYLIQVDMECYLKVLKHMAEFWDKAKEGKQP